MNELIENYFNNLKKTLDSLDRNEIENFIEKIGRAHV